jgi:vesicle-associated membrane protein-associated protein A
VIVPAPAPATISPVRPDSSPSTEQFDDLRNKLSDAQSEIDRLRALLIAPPASESATSGFRRRALSGTMTEPGDNETEISPGESVSTTENGVPPQVVAIIALLVFTLTYLFF